MPIYTNIKFRGNTKEKTMRNRTQQTDSLTVLQVYPASVTSVTSVASVTNS